MSTPSARRPSRTIAAPAGRGTRWPCSQVTIGAATVARIAPTTTGSTIVDVLPRSQVAPTRTSAKPIRNHERRPRSRSHIGAENMRESEVASICTTVGPALSSAELVAP